MSVTYSGITNASIMHCSDGNVDLCTRQGDQMSLPVDRLSTKRLHDSHCSR